MSQNAIITGANRGIGKSMVSAFAEAGYDIWACARSASDDFENELEELGNRTGATIVPIYFDLAKEDEIKDGVKKIFSEKRNIDVLINNAGVSYQGLMMTTPVSKMREVFEVNVFSQITLMQLISRKMIKQKGGCIINMCSVGGINTTPGSFAYSTSKNIYIYICKTVALELSKYNIRVNGIALGLVDTDMGQLYADNVDIQRVFDERNIVRLCKPEEIAHAALYLASKEADYITGQVLTIDGGWSV